MKKAEAVKLNLAFYETGKPCKRGHFSLRYTKSAHCVECVKLQTKKWQKQNQEKYAQSVKKWFEHNKEIHYVRVKKWQDKNKEKVIADRKAWEKSNTGKVTAKSRKRVLSKIKRTPLWLSKEQKKSMVLEYELAVWCSKVTGIKYHVDHIVPLQGKLVSGLHVPWNLQVIPATDNLVKSNKFKE